MKKILPYLLLIALSGCKKDTLTSTPTSNIHLDKGLIAYFPFNNNYNDESGNNNNGTVSGAFLSFDEHGNPNAALNCNGNGQELIINNNGKIKFDTALSVSCQVMIRNFGRFSFVNMVNYNTGSGASFGIGTVLPGNHDLIFSAINNDAICNKPHTADQSSNLDSRYIMQPESWYSVICTFNKGVLKTYVNGSLVGSQKSKDSTLHICPDSQMLIGGWWKEDPAASLNGKIDEVRLYDREINADELQELSKRYQ